MSAKREKVLQTTLAKNCAPCGAFAGETPALPKRRCRFVNLNSFVASAII
jgi:hypothetical protein